MSIEDQVGDADFALLMAEKVAAGEMPFDSDDFESRVTRLLAGPIPDMTVDQWLHVARTRALLALALRGCEVDQVAQG